MSENSRLMLTLKMPQRYLLSSSGQAKHPSLLHLQPLLRLQRRGQTRKSSQGHHSCKARARALQMQMASHQPASQLLQRQRLHRSSRRAQQANSQVCPAACLRIQGRTSRLRQRL